MILNRVGTHRLARFLTLTVLCLLFVNVNANDTDVDHGARVYLERCALCHGSKGLGEGPMALLVHDYPNTSLKTTDDPSQSIRDIVKFGTTLSSSNELSPPWRHELEASEIAAVTAFVEALRNDFSRAQQILASVDIPPERIDGRKIYRARCESCHGATGAGDGRMSRIIKNPAPSDLTLSSLPLEEIIAIISSGGKAMGRSERMPPWGQELVYAELISVANYLTTLRIAEAE